MNEFDDLFDEKQETEYSSQNAQQHIDDFNKHVNLQQKNGILLLIYVGLMILFTFGSAIYTSIAFPNTEDILNHIEIMVEPDFTATDNNDDETNPYTLTFTAILQNNSDKNLPVAYIEMELSDDASNTLTYRLQTTNLVAGDTATLTDTINTNFVPTSVSTTKVGFDYSGEFYTIVGLLPIMFSAILFLIVDREAFAYDAKRFKQSVKRHIGKILIGFAFVWAALMLASYILDLLGVSGTSENEMTIQSMFSSNPLQLVLLFLLLCVFTPITEEIIFRKVVFNYVESKTNYIWGIVASGLIFGLMHVISYGDFIQSIPYVLMGLVFGYIYYEAKKNIFVTIGVHFINNFISFILYAFAAYGLYSF